jgi:acyl-CoA thioester hydrolase
VRGPEDEPGRAILPRSMGRPHELLIRVRYSETDQMGVVHHASYLVYLEEGRTALMRTLGFPYEEVERRGFAMAVRSIEVRYRAAARYGDQVIVRTRVERFRGASIRYAYEVERASDHELLATAVAEVACLALAGFRPAPLPDDIRAALERDEQG